MDNEKYVAGETTENKYKFVIEETTKEVNRVLTNWHNNESLKKIEGSRKSHFEVESMFRTYLSKFLNAKFGWRHYAHYIKQFTPLPITKNNKLVGISLSETNIYSSIDRNLRDTFILVVEDFDFSGFNEKWDRDNQDISSSKKNWEVSNIEGVSFDNIKNIKF